MIVAASGSGAVPSASGRVLPARAARSRAGGQPAVGLAAPVLRVGDPGLYRAAGHRARGRRRSRSRGGHHGRCLRTAAAALRRQRARDGSGARRVAAGACPAAGTVDRTPGRGPARDAPPGPRRRRARAHGGSTSSGGSRCPTTPRARASTPDPARPPRKFLTIGLGPGIRNAWPCSGAMALAVLGFSVLRLARVWRAEPAERARALGLPVLHRRTGGPGHRTGTRPERIRDPLRDARRADLVRDVLRLAALPRPEPTAGRRAPGARGTGRRVGQYGVRPAVRHGAAGPAGRVRAGPFGRRPAPRVAPPLRPVAPPPSGHAGALPADAAARRGGQIRCTCAGIPA